jgi:glycosyltransferase involved in cell wall biosynthesis
MTRVAIIHDWLTGMRGGEYVLEAMAELFPQAELFTLLCIPEKISPALRALKCHTSWLQTIPLAQSKYRHFLPLMPGMIERFNLSEYDLILSSSHCVAKGVIKAPHAVHISYVHAPMRYMWDRYDEYFGPGQASLPVRLAAQSMRSYLQNWDRRVSAATRIDSLIANSDFIAQQIQAAYGRQAEVIHPFANLNRFQSPRKPGKNYLIVSAFAPYKRIDLAIQAFNQLELPLLIVGSGQNEKELKKMAGPTIQFLGSLSNEAIAQLYSECRALIFPGVEDFGITPIEAMAAGSPVIALKRGGATETITEKTGIFFEEQTPTGLIEAVRTLEQNPLQIIEQDCRERAAQFTKQNFQSQLMNSITATLLRAERTL